MEIFESIIAFLFLMIGVSLVSLSHLVSGFAFVLSGMFIFMYFNLKGSEKEAKE